MFTRLNKQYSQYIHTLPLLFEALDLIFLNPCLCVCRADTESTSEHLEALKKLSSDLVEQRATLEELRDQRQAILPRLSLLDKELVKQQVRTVNECNNVFVLLTKKIIRWRPYNVNV